MAIPFGKLAILVGAGIVGSVLANEARMPSVSEFVSGGFKMVLKQARQAKSDPSVKRPRNESLLAQVNSLREELQILASNGPVTIITSSGKSGASKFGIVIVVVVMGYGYIWWKGWKLPDMMFATRRSLSDASTSVSKQLESVYSSIAATRRHLSSKIDHLDSNVDEFTKLTATAETEASRLQERAQLVGRDVKSVRDAVLTLETKITRIEEKQELTNKGVHVLCEYAWNSEKIKTTERIQASSSSSRLFLESPPVTHSRTGSLPVDLSIEPPSPSMNGNQKVEGPLRNTVSAFGLKDINNILEDRESSSTTSTPRGSNGIVASEDTSDGILNSGQSEPKPSGNKGYFFTRIRSAANYVLNSNVKNQ